MGAFHEHTTRTAPFRLRQCKSEAGDRFRGGRGRLLEIVGDGLLRSPDVPPALVHAWYPEFDGYGGSRVRNLQSWHYEETQPADADLTHEPLQPLPPTPSAPSKAPPPPGRNGQATGQQEQGRCGLGDRRAAVAAAG